MSNITRAEIVQQLLEDPLDYSSYTIMECRALQDELRRLAESERALVGVLEACLSLLECHEAPESRAPGDGEPQCMRDARALIAATKEARNG